MKDELIVRFVNWTKLKVKLHFSNDIDFYFKEREVWWSCLGVNIGFEQDGKHDKFERPVLVLKKFNKHILWVLPLTSKVKIGKYYYDIEYNNKKYQIILSQLKLISSKRLTRKIRRISNVEFNNIKEKIKTFL